MINKSTVNQPFKGMNIDLGYLIENAGGSRDFIEDIIRAFLKNEHNYIQQLKSIFQKNDQEQLGFYCHKIRSNYATLGVERGLNFVNEVKSLDLGEISSTEKENWLEQFIALHRDIKNELLLILNSKDTPQR